MCELKKLRIGIGIIFIRWEVFANYSQIPKIYFSLIFFKNILFLDSYIFLLNNLQGKQSYSDIYPYSLYIYIVLYYIIYIILYMRIRYSWISLKIYLNRNDIRQVTIFANRNNIHEMKLWQIGIRIYLSHKYQRKDSWGIYSQTIRELFANIELFAEHWAVPLGVWKIFIKNI